MTDNEVIKALECCGDPYSLCVECPIKADRRCNEYLANYALDLINRQQTEIEGLKNDNMAKEVEYNDMLEQRNSVEDHIETAKSEAVKEFAERLKEKAYPFPFGIGVENAVTIRAINDLVEEAERALKDRERNDTKKN